MQETISDIRTRRSCRKYLPEQITDAQLDTILEAATWTPTGRGKQSPQMVVVQAPAMLSKLSALNAAVMGTDTDPMYGAPTAVVVFADKTNENGIADASLLMGTLMLAAHAVGVASCWINRGKGMFELPEGQAIMQKWGVEDKYEGFAICILGYAAEGGIPPVKPRREGYVIRG
ncbi:MAG: nitroreductase family protein [Akkermansiaceae bacterium]|nr:nitroreductase family protein [Akkermansiaceae bacterium]